MLSESKMDTLIEYISVKTILLSAMLGLVGYWIMSWAFKKTSKNLPPGPREWNTTWKLLKATWNDSIVELTTEWAMKYGPITFVSSLGQQIAFLNSPELVRKLFSSDEYKLLLADRMANAASRLVWYNRKDLIFTKFDDIMQKKRRMFFKVIGLYGEGVDKFENVVWGEMERMFAEIEKFQGKDMNLSLSLSRSLKIIIYILAMGERPSDPTIPDILEEYDNAFNKLSAPDVDFVLDKMPILTKIPGKYKQAMNRLSTARKAAEELIYFNPKKTHVPGQPRGIADLLFDLQKKPGNEWMDTDPEHIIAFLVSLFFAAHLTTRASLVGSFLCLMNYPNVAKRIQEEVDRVIGSDRPKLSYRSNMPYTKATILEVLRYVSQLPLNSFRIATVDINFDGMTIPKDTVIMANSGYIFRDEKLWENQGTFNPERFLDSEGNLLPVDHPTRKNLIAFGAGVRSCPGEGFVRSRVFLFLTGILQRFDIRPPVNEKLVPADFQTKHEDCEGLIRQAPPFKCRLIRREKTN
uniref:Cytochrome P450 n=1 Tax=Arion vulgaris TaxID=1028688 RepID=A0A0B7BIT7_9EUPU